MTNEPRKSARRGMGSVYLRGKTYWIKYYRHGEPVRESCKSSKKQDAIDLLKQRLGEAVTGAYFGVPSARIRMEDLFAMVADDYITRGKRDVYQLKARIRKHLQPALGHMKAAEFGSDEIAEYIKRRQRAKAQHATINRELSIIRRGFNLAAQMDPPKVGRVPHISRLPEDNARSGFIEDREYRGLLPHVRRARLALVIGYHLGNRAGEIFALEWSMVDLESRQIRIPGRLTKNKKPRTLPIYGEMETELREARAQQPNAKHVLTDTSGKRIRSFKGEWKAACKKAGLDGLLFHDLRRSAVRNMVRAGIPDQVAMAISGHKTRSVFDRYNIVSGEDLAEAARKLERAQNTKKTGTAQIDDKNEEDVNP